MKKIVLVLAVIIGILCINKTEKVIIPKESIRLRVIANSDCSKDQNLKKKIVKNLSTKFAETNNLKNIKETRNYINKKLPEFTETVDKTIKEQFNLLRVVDNEKYPAFFDYSGTRYLLKIYKAEK